MNATGADVFPWAGLATPPGGSQDTGMSSQSSFYRWYFAFTWSAFTGRPGLGGRV
jgi:hypothetical protein